MSAAIVRRRTDGEIAGVTALGASRHLHRAAGIC